MDAVPRTVWIVVAALCASAMGIGLWLGNRGALDEGQVIAHYAQRYAAQTGGRMGDCHAVPGRRATIWLTVICEGAAGRFAYPVGQTGQLVEVEGEEA